MSASPSGNDAPVEVTTMTVSVHTLRVGRKQVSLSMFRQLPEADVFTDETHSGLRAQPWGIVRYRWGDQPDSAFHVVFVLDGALHRCLVTRDAGVPPKQYSRYERARRAAGQSIFDSTFNKKITHDFILRHYKKIGVSGMRPDTYDILEARNKRIAARVTRLQRIFEAEKSKLDAATSELRWNHRAMHERLADLPQLFIAV